MRYLVFLAILIFTCVGNAHSQSLSDQNNFKKHDLVWSTGLFKSWLKDTSVEFNKIGHTVSPIFIEEKKTGLSLQSHYMYKPSKLIGVGFHLGLGLDIYSNIKSPVALFGGSISVGSNHQFIIDFGWADGKKKIVPDAVRNKLLEETYTEIPEVYQQTELNTAFYLGLSYRIF